MTLTINHPDADELARELVSYTGETVTQAILNALRERLEREKEKRSRGLPLQQELLRIGRECAALPILDNRTPEEILGYNQDCFSYALAKVLGEALLFKGDDFGQTDVRQADIKPQTPPTTPAGGGEQPGH